ncbi:MAG TPA: L,D-transpeptidase [Opitutaceae bacterium]|nr:L,D-transpeptidase [Opitutaceae bacterium]
MEQVNQTCARLGIKPGERVMVARISTATLQFFRKGALVKSYVISTSRRPPSNIKGSLGTPRGLHEIAERIGAGQPPGMVFKSRVPTGRHYSEIPNSSAGENNLITTRILWLRGMEPGVNRGGDVDSYARYIYVHGTNHEGRVGEPISAGCLLMRDLDIVELFEEVRAGDLVWIAD